MEPLEATLFRVTADDLTSEFTHFNLIIHLGKVEQLAFRLCSFFTMSRHSRCPYEPLRIVSLLA